MTLRSGDFKSPASHQFRHPGLTSQSIAWQPTAGDAETADDVTLDTVGAHGAAAVS